MLNIESMKALRSDGIAQAPFLATQATVALVGNALYETFRDNMSDAERRQIRTILNQAEAKSRLELQSKLRQSFDQ